MSGKYNFSWKSIRVGDVLEDVNGGRHEVTGRTVDRVEFSDGTSINDMRLLRNWHRERASRKHYPQ